MAVALVVSIIPSGAFTSVSANREVSVSVASDDQALLTLEPTSEYARLQGGMLELRFDGTGTLGGGLNPFATTTVSGAFDVENSGTQPVVVTIADNTSAIRLTTSEENGSKRLDGPNASGVVLQPGEQAAVTVVLESTDGSELESVDTLTVNAEATTNNGESGADTGAGSNETDGGGTGSAGSESIASDPQQFDSDAVETVRATTTNSDEDTVTASASNVGGNSVVAVDAESLSLNETTVGISELQFGTTDNATPGDISVTLTSLNESEVDASQPYGSNASYLRVDHPDIPNQSVDDARLRLRVPKSAVPERKVLVVSRYRPEQGVWNRHTARYAGETDDSYLYVIDVPGLSLFSFTWNQYVQSGATRAAINGTANETAATIQSPTPYVRYRESFTTAYWRQRALPYARDAAARIREELSEYTYMGGPQKVGEKAAFESSSRGASKYLSRVDSGAVQASRATKGIGRALSCGWPAAIADDLRDDNLEDIGDAAICTTQYIPVVGPAIKYLLKGADLAWTLDQIARDLGPGVQNRVVGIHVDSDQSGQAQDELTSDLDQVIVNSRALQTARAQNNTTRVRQLQRQRLKLLRETYRELPQYTTSVHTSVSTLAAGGEDIRAYRPIRSHIASLRMQLILDYRRTYRQLRGANPPTPLATEARMPAHGWEALGRSQVYDTIERPEDYAVYRVNTSAVNDTVVLKVTGLPVSGFQTAVTDEQPADPREVSGQTVPLGINGTTRLIRLRPNSGVKYLTVRAQDGAFQSVRKGPYRVIARTDSGIVDRNEVPLEPIELPGQDVKRPKLELTQGPERYTLADGDVVRTTSNGDVTLSWSVFDAKTPPENLVYRYRVDDGSGFSGLSAPQPVGSDGEISLDFDFDSGVKRVQVSVRDEAGRTVATNVDVVVSSTVPQALIAAPGGPDSRTVKVKVVPDERIRRLELQYRPEDDPGNWTDWKTLTDPRGLADFQFPKRGEFVVRARAVGVSGTVGAWSQTSISVRDTTPPRARLVDGPPVLFDIGEPDSVNTSDQTLVWAVSDNVAETENLSYRVIVDGPNIATRTTEWQSVPADGRVRVSRTFTEGQRTVRVQVRDTRGNVGGDRESLKIDLTAPQLANFDAEDDVTGAIVSTESNATDVDYVQLQYKRPNETEWRAWETIGLGNGYAVGLGATGTFDVRARPVDEAGNAGAWRQEAFTSVPDTGGTTVNVDVNVSGGDAPSFDANESDRVTFRGAAQAITGEALLQLYLQNRDNGSLQLAEIELTEDENISVAADLPDNITDDSRLVVEVVGEGSVILDSLRRYDSDVVEPSIAVTPSTPTANESVSFRAELPSSDASVKRIEWDLNGDGTTDQTGRTVNTTLPAGNTTVAATVVNVFGETTEATRTVSVNSPPDPSLAVPETAYIGRNITLSAANATDPDGTITNIAWDIDNDSQFEASGETLTVSYATPGNRSINVVVTDDTGTTRTVTRTLRVQRAPLNVSLTATSDTTSPGNTVVLEYRARNEEPTALENVSINVESVPEAWTVVAIRGSGATAVPNTTAVGGELSSAGTASDTLSAAVVIEPPPNASLGTKAVAANVTVNGFQYNRTTAKATVDAPNVTLATAGSAAAPGSVVTVETTVENADNRTVENVALDVASLPDGWTVVDAQVYGPGRWNGTERVTNTERLGSADTASDQVRLRLRVRVPADAARGAVDIPVAVRVGGRQVSAGSVTANVEAPDLAVSTTDDTDSAGNDVLVGWRVRNRESYRAENVTVDVGALPDGWTVTSVSTIDGEAYNETESVLRASLSGGRYDDDTRLRLRITVPNNAAPGEYHIPATIRAGSTTVATRNVTVRVETPDLSVSTADDTDAPGNQAVVTWRVQNNEDATIENVSIDVEDLPDGWTLVSARAIGEGSYEADATRLRATLRDYYRADDTRLRYRVQIPANASAGVYQIPASVTVAGATVTEANTTVRVATPDIRVTTRNDTDIAGNPTTVQWRVQNRESTTVENVSIDVGELPDGWTLERVSTYGQGSFDENATRLTGTLRDYYRADDATVRYRLRIPGNASNGTYRIPATVTAGAETIATRNVSVTVEEPNIDVSTVNDTDAAGNAVEVSYRVYNAESTTIENVTIDVGDLPDGWRVERVRTFGQGQYNASETRLRATLRDYYRADDTTLRYRLIIPENASKGRYKIPAAVRVAGATLERVNTTVTVAQPDIAVSTTGDTDAPGNIAEIGFRARNQESTTIENVELDVGDLPDGWVIERSQSTGEGSYNTSTSTVSATLRSYYRADDAGVRYRVRIPANASDGVYTVPVRVTVANGTIAVRNATIRVETPAIDTYVDGSTDVPGNTAEVTYRVSNQESTTLEDVTVDVGDLPEGWTVTNVQVYGRGSYNETRSRLQATLRDYYRADSTQVDVEVKIPANATVGNRTIPATVGVGAAKVTQLNATVNVAKPEFEATASGDKDAPGNRVTVSYRVENREDATIEDMAFSLEDLPPGWQIVEVQSQSAGIYHPENATVTARLGPYDPGSRYYEDEDQIDLAVTIAVPDNASLGEYTLNGTATASGVPVGNASVGVSVIEPEMSISTQNSSDAPGNTVRLEYRLQNQEYTTIEDVNLTLASLPAGWEVVRVESTSTGSFDNETRSVTTALDGYDPGSRYYEDEDQIDLVVVAEIPSNASPGTYHVPATATVDDDRVASGVATATVEEPEVTITAEDAADMPGNRVQISYRVTNRESYPVENVNFSLGMPPKGWSVVSIQSTSRGTYDATTRSVSTTLDRYDPGSRYYEDEDQIDLAVTLDIPDNATRGEYQIAGNATVGALGKVTATNATVAVETPSLQVSSWNATGTAGETVTLDTRVVNEEAYTVENVSLSVGTLPDEWALVNARSTSQGNYNSTEQTVSTALRRNDPGNRYYEDEDQIDLAFDVAVPSGAATGTYDIPIVVRIDGETVHQTTVTVTVESG